MAHPRGWWLALAIPFAVACGGGGGTDSGRDAGPDLPPTETIDPGVVDDGVPDTGRDLPADDLAPDLGFDAADDAAPDLPPADEGVADESPDPAPDAPADADVPLDAADVAPDLPDLCDGPWCAPCVDDGLACTDSFRDDAGYCYDQVQPDWCVVDGNCFHRDQEDPANPCRTCQPDLDSGAFLAAPGKTCQDTTPCSTGGACTAAATCAPVAAICDDRNPCTVDRCVGGACEHQIPTAPSTCDDGDKCTQFDRCDAGVCKGTPRTCAQDNDVCTTDACDPATGQCVRTFNVAGCDDANWCTIDDACALGRCTGRPRDCSDGNACTNDYCIQDGNDIGHCEARPFQGACEDGDLCTLGETCGVDGVCRGGEPRTCNDFNACTDDACYPDVGCVFQPNANACDDGDPCTVSDKCTAGACKGSPRNCDDGNPCTQDGCQFGSCYNVGVPNDTPCEDGDICSTGDRCLNSYCTGLGTLSCDDGNACSVDTCVPGVGCTFAAASCDDGNPCTTDSCDRATGCRHVPNANACNDGDACTLNDQCINGTCTGVQNACSDGDPCTNDRCAGGTCLHEPNLGSCEDGNLCTQGEKCFAGKCQGGTAVLCNDLSNCTTDSCNPSVGCVFTPVAGTCDDYSVCTVNDACSGGKCVGTPINCDDGNFCTDDLCSPTTGCYHENNALLCNDNNLCTIMDQCGGGSCQGFNLFANPLSKSATLTFSTTGLPGQGLDVDGVAGTCAPAGDCSDGIDNFFGKMGIFITDQFKADMDRVQADGRLALLLEHESPGPGAGPYELNLMFGKRTAPTSCNPATAGCNYLVFAGDLIGSCAPRYVLNNAKVEGDVLTAGGKEFQAVVYFAIGNVMLPQVLKWAQVKATVTRDGNGRITGGSGVLGGAIDVKTLKLSLESVDAAQFSPYTKDQIIQQLDSRLCGGTSECGDLDTDTKAGKDAASIGLSFTLTTGNGVGKI